MAEFNLTGGIGQAVDAALTTVRHFFPSKTEEQQREFALLLAIIQGQSAINVEDAKSGSLFRGGWRPATGWVCVSGLALQFIVKPLAEWGIVLSGRTFPPLPSLDVEFLLGLLVPLLGLGYYRTRERLAGKA